ncbi:hypothetical protein MYCTH_2302619 [Thermothelomyces thermophilus ATCC 42464]|uniref:Uncharacterized protein n=1 Tax=Thermothelomyces thermophilus (strain ATCC 42464 / BCRC 31852 / DSM 1799) TaxID=573729 RepID=G2Q827_THET4|nr:uncharacterized protein MYCTH_2302619 [Thermothelomyces thermophilus ATCC 42464]AEO56984.1 hypothetical protein MYCTH_2302619 [Thermothelomyces thermophilus ATCC 42464]
MSPSTTASTKSRSSFTSPRIDPGAPIINCSYPGCPAKIDGKRQIMCEAHLHVMSNTDKYRDFAQENGTHTAQAPKGTFGIPLQTLSSTNPRQLLPDTAKDRPITGRKPAGNPPHAQQQPPPKHSTFPFLRGESVMTPTSVRPLAPRPPAHLPTAGPAAALRDGEPMRKRPRLSPAPGQTPNVQVNGAVQVPSLPSPADSVSRNGPQSSQPGRAREAEVKSSPKQSFRHPVRRMPLELSSLRFIDDPEDRPPGMVSEQSGPGVRSAGGSDFRKESGASDWLPNGNIRDHTERKTSSSASSTTLAASIDSEGAKQRPLELRSGQDPTLSPDKTKLGAQPGHEPNRANGVATSEPRPEGARVPIRPVTTATAHPIQARKTKEIDIDYFDALIYSQPGASSPPPNVDLVLAAVPPPPPPPPPPSSSSSSSSSGPTPQTVKETVPPEEKDEPLYLDIDPRIHWPQPHSAAWHARKQKEIRARGNRKANFGRAAQSLRRQRREREKAGLPFEETLPDKIAENPAWVRVLRRLKGLPPTASASASSSHSSSSPSFSHPGEEEHGSGPLMNGSANGDGVTEKRGKKKHPGVTGRRVGNSGIVVVTGLNGMQMGSMRRSRGDA